MDNVSVVNNVIVTIAQKEKEKTIQKAYNRQRQKIIRHKLIKQMTAK